MLNRPVSEGEKEPPKRHCHACNQDLPATTKYFYPSYFKKGRNTCKRCHNKQSKRRDYDILKRRAQPISEEEAKTTRYMAMRPASDLIGWSRGKLIHALTKREDIPLFRAPYRNHGISVLLLKENAAAYIEEIQREASQPTPPIVLQTRRKRTDLMTFGSPEQCGACGSCTSNIFGDVDGQTRNLYGYLCTRCMKLVNTYGGDVPRLGQVLVYLKATRKKTVPPTPPT